MLNTWDRTVMVIQKIALNAGYYCVLMPSAPCTRVAPRNHLWKATADLP